MNNETEFVDYNITPQELEVRIARRTLARVYLRGKGIEVGAGTRPWPLPVGVECFYGDVLNDEELEKYFKETGSAYNGFVDAQTYLGIDNDSYDFALSAHVIEHIVNPLGSIQNALRVIRPGGILMFALPDKRYTFDEPRPTTPTQHLINDFKTGGSDSLIESYLEHIRYLHPQWAPPIDAELHQVEAEKLLAIKFDTHFHTWTTETLGEMLEWVENNLPAKTIHRQLVLNENIVVLRKTARPWLSRFARKISARHDGGS